VGLLQITDEVRSELVMRLGWMFSVVYTWSFNTPEKREALENFRITVGSFVEEWRHFMGQDKL